MGRAQGGGRPLGALLSLAAILLAAAAAAPRLSAQPFSRLGTKENSRSPRARTYSQSAALTAVGLQGYQRYHANDSLIGQPVDCSHQEKICFRFNMLYDTDYGCIAFRYRDADFSFNHLVAVAKTIYDKGCEGYVMAYDDRCYRKEVVRDVICGCPNEPTRNFLQGVECRCVPPSPIRVEQPKEDGKCRIPDLWFPDEDRSLYFGNPYQRIQGFTSDHIFVKKWDVAPRFHCAPEQQQCFAHGQVWMEEDAACFPLLRRGPCPEEHVVALDVQAALDGHVEATCEHERGGCPPGHVRMVFDGRCHNKEDIQLIVHGYVIRNQFGLFVATKAKPDIFRFLPKLQRGTGQNKSQVCVVVLEFDYLDVRYAFSLEKTVNSRRYEVENDPPLPE